MERRYKTTEVITRGEHSNYEKSVYSITARDDCPTPGHVARLFFVYLRYTKAR